MQTIRGYAIRDLLTVECTPWDSRGGKGVFINLEGTGGFNDTYIYELASGESSAPIRHIYEETVFILKGYGSTDFSIDKNKWQGLEWQERSYFSIPPNSWHQFHNGSSRETMRYVAMTSAPRIIDAFKSLDFIFNNPYVFRDRFNGEDGYFKQSELAEPGTLWFTNFVADVLGSTPKPDPDLTAGRGGGASHQPFQMVNGTVHSHSRSFPPGAYAKFHRHGPGIHVLIMQGEGYSILYPEGGEMEHIDWGAHSMFVPPEQWWHSHFSTGKDPAYFVAMGWGSDKAKSDGTPYVNRSKKEDGNTLLEYEDEDPAIHAEFEAELAKKGAMCLMNKVHPRCTGIVR